MGVGERVGGGITKFILQGPRNHSFRRRRVTKGNVVCWSKQCAGIIQDRSDMVQRPSATFLTAIMT